MTEKKTKKLKVKPKRTEKVNINRNSWIEINSSNVIDNEIATEKQRLEKRTKETRLILFIFLFISFTGIVLTFIFLTKGSRDIFGLNISAAISFLLTAPVVGFTLAFITGYYFKDNSKSKIEELSTRKRIATRLEEVRKISIAAYLDELVNLNIENLTIYYKQVENHTNRSFYAGFIAAIIGFLLIVTGIVLTFVVNNNYFNSVIVSASGLLSGFISTIFFTLYNKTVLQMKKYHDNLIEAQNVLLAFRVLESIKSDNNRDKTIHMMVGELVKKSVIKEIEK